MPIFTLSHEDYLALYGAVVQTERELEAFAQQQSPGQFLTQAIADKILLFSRARETLQRGGTSGTFDPTLAKKVLELVNNAATGMPVSFLFANDSLEIVAHAARLAKMDMFAGHENHQGVTATGGLNDKGQVLLDVLRAWV